MGWHVLKVSEALKTLLLLHLLLHLVLFSAHLGRAKAEATVTGCVFCDQCRDGQRSLLDYPLSGATVAVSCAGNDGMIVTYKQETTNWFGTYTVRFEGSPDQSRCQAQVVGGPTRCWSGTRSVQSLKLLFRILDTELYTVGPLLAQPDHPMGFCRAFGSPVPPGSSVPSAPPVVVPPPPIASWHPPPFPFLEASACPYLKWAMPEYRCYWKVVRPDTKVVVAFGFIAAEKYGMDITLSEALQGKGDLYWTLLREGTTALLNSYNSLQFFYPTLIVIDYMNKALLGTPHEALTIALRFRRANSGAVGYGGAQCKFSACS